MRILSSRYSINSYNTSHPCFPSRIFFPLPTALGNVNPSTSSMPPTAPSRRTGPCPARSTLPTATVRPYPPPAASFASMTAPPLPSGFGSRADRSSRTAPRWCSGVIPSVSGGMMMPSMMVVVPIPVEGCATGTRPPTCFTTSRTFAGFGRAYPVPTLRLSKVALVV